MTRSIFRSKPTRDETQSRSLILATQALDQASALALMVETYVVLERLITHEFRESTDGHSLLRADLGALMRALNGDLARQVDALVRHTSVLHGIAANEAGLH
ncbi:hypothetical protein [Hydrogenophaga sp.]|uniref:hypothetical protein n=1 Tax=Hydrogenophaga sp. TaxID=1904254 RepID=UPI003F71ABEE